MWWRSLTYFEWVRKLEGERKGEKVKERWKEETALQSLGVFSLHIQTLKVYWNVIMMSIWVSSGCSNVELGMGTRNNGDKTKSVLFFFNLTNLYERYMAVRYSYSVWMTSLQADKWMFAQRFVNKQQHFAMYVSSRGFYGYSIGLAGWATLVRLAGSSSWPTLNSPADWAEWAAWMIAWDLSIYLPSHLLPWERGGEKECLMIHCLHF